PLHFAGDEAAVLGAAKRFPDPAGGGVDAGRRRVRQSGGNPPAVHVPGAVCAQRDRDRPAGAGRLARAPQAGARAVQRRHPSGGQSLSAVQLKHPGSAQLRVEYVDGAQLAELLRQDDVLAVFGFGTDAPRVDDPRYLRVPLQPHGAAPLEVWRTGGTVAHGRSGDIAWASDGRLSFGVIEVDEAGIGIREAARIGYEAMTRHVGGSGTPELLRVWNYLDAITLGDGDAERYRQFCLGRAAGLGEFDTGRLPAATAIGRCDEERVFQLYWLSAREAGTPVENPRQVSAYRYPRQYGPQPPSFARAMLPADGADMPLL